MTDWKLRLYHHLPSGMRDLAASIRGYQLRQWRYGAETDSLAEAALERDYWTPDQWKTYHEERLPFLLNRAATQVPYYQDLWSKRRRAGDQSSWEYLENWHILEKEALRLNPHAFVAADRSIREMFHEHTSGTTGKSLDLWWNRRMVREWYALFEARWRRWYGVTRHHRWAILGGQLIVPQSQEKPPFWVWNAPLNQLYMSSYHLSPKLIPYYVQALSDHKIDYLLCYTSSAYAIAAAAKEQNLPAPKLKVVITNAEPIYDYQRELIIEVFDCPVKETYGLSEAVAAASECEHGHLHFWNDVGILEVLVDNQPVAPGQEGDFVCTGLLNLDMPLIRYRVGDQGALSQETSCECNRTLPRLAKISGRIDDVLYTRDGRLIGRLDPVFKTALPIVEAQIVQETLSTIRVCYVPAVNFTPDAEISIAERLRQRLGDVEIKFERVESIPRGTSGKFRAVICNLSPEERARISK